MKFLTTILLLLAAFSLGFALKATLDNDIVANHLYRLAPMIAQVVLAIIVVVGLCLALSIFLFKKWLGAHGVTTKMADTEMVDALVKHFTTPDGVQNPTNEERRNTALANLGLLLVRRGASEFYFRIVVTVVAGFAGVFGLYLAQELNELTQSQTALLETQTKLTEDQNRRLLLQTDANITDTILLESTRRASLSGEIETLRAEIRAETSLASSPDSEPVLCPVRDAPTTYAGCWKNDPTQAFAQYYLSDELAARVEEFLIRSTPYRLVVTRGINLDFDVPLRDQFSFPEASPERGVILETLLQSRVAIGFDNFNFNHAYLAGAVLAEDRLENARLSQAYLPSANLQRAKPKASSLVGSHLRRANLSQANMFGANLSEADFAAATLREVVLKDGYLAYANFEGASFSNSDLSGVLGEGAVFRRADFSSAILEGAVFESSDLMWANFQESNLTRTSFSGANLSGAIFTGSKLLETNFERSWAWNSEPPIGLPETIEIDLCEGELRSEIRVERPEDC